MYMLQSLRRILTRIATYVCHQHRNTLYLKKGKLMVYAARDAAIDITIHGSQGSKSVYLIGKLQRAYISCMPYLVARCKELFDGLIKAIVGIRNHANLHNFATWV